MCVGRGSRRHRHWPFIATTCTPARSRSLFCPLPACSAQLRLLMRAIRRGTATEACGARRGNSTVEHPCNLRLGHRPGDHGRSYFALARLRVPAHPLVLVQVGMTAHPDTPRSPTPCLLFALPSVTGSGRYGQLSRSITPSGAANRISATPLLANIFKSQKGASEDRSLSSTLHGNALL